MSSKENPETKQAVLALIPAWNEATRIGPVVKGTQAHLPVLVVDDGSSDETAAVAQAAGATVVRHAENQRKGAALKTGFTWALEHDYDAVITLDADGQHDPADIPKFLTALEAGRGDLIVGQRDYAQMPWPRRWSNPAGQWLLCRVLGADIPDNQSGYRLLTRRFIEQLRPTSTGFEMEVEMIADAVQMGVPIASVPVRTIYDVDKESYFHPLQDSWRFIKMVWQIWKRQRQG